VIQPLNKTKRCGFLLEGLDEGEEDNEETEQESRWRCVSRRRSLSQISEKNVLFERNGSRDEVGRNNKRLDQRDGEKRVRDGRGLLMVHDDLGDLWVGVLE
jgi:hypothetical protein